VTEDKTKLDRPHSKDEEGVNEPIKKIINPFRESDCYIYHQSIMMSETSWNFPFSTQNVLFMAFMWFTELTAIISLGSSNRFVSVIEGMHCIFCALRSEFLNKLIR
jgi:hypothetical protein